MPVFIPTPVDAVIVVAAIQSRRSRKAPFEWSDRERSLSVGSTDATGVSSPHLAISFGISARSPVQLRNLTVHGVGQSLRGRQHVTATWHTKSASLEEALATEHMQGVSPFFLDVSRSISLAFMEGPVHSVAPSDTAVENMGRQVI